MIRSNNAIKFTPAYGLRQTAKPLRDLAAAYRWRYVPSAHDRGDTLITAALHHPPRRFRHRTGSPRPIEISESTEMKKSDPVTRVAT